MIRERAAIIISLEPGRRRGEWAGETCGEELDTMLLDIL
jgi:hypothetical protein